MRYVREQDSVQMTKRRTEPGTLDACTLVPGHIMSVVVTQWAQSSIFFCSFHCTLSLRHIQRVQGAIWTFVAFRTH